MTWRICRWFLFRLDPETAHNLTIWAIEHRLDWPLLLRRSRRYVAAETAMRSH